MSSPYFAGVDVGGTNIKVGLVDSSGTVIANDKFPTQPSASPSSNLEHAAQMILRLAAENQLEASGLASVGLATPGPMDISAGIVLTPFNLPGWWRQNVRDILSQSTGRPVVFANDAGAAAFGEFWVGSGQAYSSAVLLTLGTGVGGGIIVDGKSIDGAHSHGAEIGHMIVNSEEKHARMCKCGKAGHLEAYASATALVEIATEYLAAGQTSSLKDNISDDSPLSTLKIYHAAEGGDELANRVISETARWLGMGISSLCHIIDPAVVLLGGAMNFGGQASATGRRFLAEVHHHAATRLLPKLSEKLTIKFASLGSDAGFIGAAGLAKHHHHDHAVSA